MKFILTFNFSLLLSIFLTIRTYAQDFYINQNLNKINLNYVIPPQWIDLNYDESYDFLYKSGFTDLKTKTLGKNEIVTGRIPNKDYIYIRKLVFENQIIKEYSDAVIFIQECALCFTNELKSKLSNNTELTGVFSETLNSGAKADNELKDMFYKYHRESLLKDGINDELRGNLTDYGFKFTNSIKRNDFTIIRNCSLRLDENKLYNFYSERRVLIVEKDYKVGNYDLKNLNQYDLNLIINVFLQDCKNHNINIKNGKVIASFEQLEGELLGLSYGINNDLLIKIKIDPIKWEKASVPKRWYLIYHELGHDVLNLKHGNGGKMMFNFADKGYSWREF